MGVGLGDDPDRGPSGVAEDGDLGALATQREVQERIDATLAPPERSGTSAPPPPMNAEGSPTPSPPPQRPKATGVARLVDFLRGVR